MCICQMNNIYNVQFIYIYNHTHTYIYIYVYWERERETIKIIFLQFVPCRTCGLERCSKSCEPDRTSTSCRRRPPWSTEHRSRNTSNRHESPMFMALRTKNEPQMKVRASKCRDFTTQCMDLRWHTENPALKPFYAFKCMSFLQMFTSSAFNHLLDIYWLRLQTKKTTWYDRNSMIQYGMGLHVAKVNRMDLYTFGLGYLGLLIHVSHLFTHTHLGLLWCDRDDSAMAWRRQFWNCYLEGSNPPSVRGARRKGLKVQ
jgi:hypothetical protein